MQTLIQNKEKYFILKDKVINNDISMFSHYVIKNIELDEKTISIIMTSSNRSKQTYHTLKTIQNSSYKNIQLIIVDDSTHDPIQMDILETFPFYIDFFNINRQNKDWINPVVNYNIGFNFVKGSYVIIQNAEVCHVGDVIQYLIDNAQDNNYYVFDVKAINNMESNEEIYQIKQLDTSIYQRENLFLMWYQHKTFNRNLHFLTGMTYSTFKKINGFSYDYSLTIDYDDNDFILRIFSKHIKINNISNDIFNIGGIHLYHVNAHQSWLVNCESNNILYKKKEEYYNKSGYYIDVTNNLENFDEEYKKLLI
jgi:hypothetical protein